MTKYIGKKIIVSLAILLAAGFVLYMLVCTSVYDSHGIIIGPHTAVRYGDELYLYDVDLEAEFLSFHYFIPVDIGDLYSDTLYLPGEVSPEYDFDAKYYASPFTRKHIVKRYGLVDRVFYTLHSIESIS